jgi:hypothetical protein
LAHVAREADGSGLAVALDWFRDRPIGRIRIGAVSLIVVPTRRLHGHRYRIADLSLLSP